MAQPKARTFMAKSGNVWRYQKCDPAAHPAGHTSGWVRDADGRIGSALAHVDGLEGVDRDRPVKVTP